MISSALSRFGRLLFDPSQSFVRRSALFGRSVADCDGFRFSIGSLFSL